ncbi:MAG: hypothetical protein JWL60_618 [Gemmatimonadetes bacterium]|jgi:hypothetical protein|nr:hypothetical protein [Gemmatimonadota bacterium]
MRRILSGAALLLLAIAPAAEAQRASASAPMPLEFGMDAGLSFGTGGTDNSVEFGLPVPSVRVGFHMSPAWSVEPSLSLFRTSVTGESATVYELGIAALYHFSAVRTAPQLYARPFFNFTGANTTVRTSPTTTVSTSDTGTEFGAGFGAKLPWRDRMAWRLEGNISRLSDNVPSGQTRVGLLAGLSYFTR